MDGMNGFSTHRRQAGFPVLPQGGKGGANIDHSKNVPHLVSCLVLSSMQKFSNNLFRVNLRGVR